MGRDWALMAVLEFLDFLPISITGEARNLISAVWMDYVTY